MDDWATAGRFHEVSFSDLVEHTEREVDALIEFLRLQPTSDQRRAAVAHVNPEYWHVREQADPSSPGADG